jgi:N-acetylglutamate synthase/N-acetylornithine aminotransferase
MKMVGMAKGAGKVEFNAEMLAFLIKKLYSEKRKLRESQI